MRKRGFFESRKGVSVMVGYVLLVVFLIIIGGIVYVWLKTYIPRQALECPDGISLFIKEASFDSDASQLILTLKNNGRFDVAGYFIHATNSSEQELATIDLSGYLNETQAGIIFENSVLFFEGGSNLFGPGFEDDYIFDIPAEIGVPYSVRVIPTRFQEVEGKSRFASCSNARVEQIIGEPYVCVPYTCAGLGYVCGDWWSDGCPGGETLDCGDCTDPEVCNSSGQCVAPGECTDTCLSLGYECGIWDICDGLDCGNCTVLYGSGYTCNNATGQCESLCGNSVIDEGEECDDGNPNNGDGCSSICLIESGFMCAGEPSLCELIDSCPSYCVYLNYSNGYCTNSIGNCESDPRRTHESGGDQWCGEVAQADICCCIS
jgi:cysteine-rich repeat protein